MNEIRTMLAVAAFGALGCAHAADATTDAARTQYEAERARCMSGTTGQEQASCLRSAGAAYESIRQGKLRDPSMAYQSNALARCENLPAADRADCVSRVDGVGESSGSVKGGGVIKETVTTVPATR